MARTVPDPPDDPPEVTVVDVGELEARVNVEVVVAIAGRPDDPQAYTAAVLNLLEEAVGEVVRRPYTVAGKPGERPLGIVAEVRRGAPR